jgi:hypothetical protein
VTKLVVAIIGAATLPLAQLPNWFDMGIAGRNCLCNPVATHL